MPVCACPCLQRAAAGGASTHWQCSQGFWTPFSEVPVGRVHVRVLARPQHVGGGRSVCARGDGTDGRYIWNVSVCVREGEVFASACWRCQHVGGTGICLCPQEVPLAMLSLGPDQELQAVPWRQVSHPSIGWHGRVGCTVYPRLPAEKVFFCISSWVHAFIMTILLQPPESRREGPGSSASPSLRDSSVLGPRHGRQGVWAASRVLRPGEAGRPRVRGPGLPCRRAPETGVEHCPRPSQGGTSAPLSLLTCLGPDQGEESQ